MPNLGLSRTPADVSSCCRPSIAEAGHSIVRSSRGGAHARSARCVAAAVAPSDDRLPVFVADLHKRGPARPRRVATLKNTMNAAFQMSLSEADLDLLLSDLKAVCRR